MFSCMGLSISDSILTLETNGEKQLGSWRWVRQQHQRRNIKDKPSERWLLIRLRKYSTSHRPRFSVVGSFLLSDLHSKAPMQRPTTVPMSDLLENHPLFTPDEEYATPLTAAALDNTHPYCPQTLLPYNQRRQEVLPVFPPASPLDDPPIKDASTKPDPLSPLLLCNVPRKFQFLS